MNILGTIWNCISYPFALFFAYLYLFVGNYGIAIILFTLVLKFVMIPLAIKQQKSMLLQVKYQPRMQEIQAKYKTDKVKLSEEMSKLYKEEGYSPAGGCLPMLIQLPIMLILYNLILNPLSNINSFRSSDIINLINRFNPLINGAKVAASNQIGLATWINENFETVKDFLPKGYEKINFWFLGVNLADKPDLAKFGVLWIIPIIAGITALIAALISQRYMVQNPQTQGTTKVMLLMSPAMSLIFTFTLPAGVGLYWIISNILTGIQSYVIGEKYNPRKYAEELKIQGEEEKNRLKQAKKDKYLNKHKDENNN